MIALNLTDAQRAELYQILRVAPVYQTRVIITIYDGSGLALSTLDPKMVLDGSVSYDADADITRSLHLSLLDPEHELVFDQNNPADYSLFADNMVGVTYGIWLPDSALWVDVPVFQGPVTGLSRVGAEVEIEAVGKEALAHDPHLVVADYLLPKGIQLKSAIKKVIINAGEAAEKCLLDNITGTLKVARPVLRGESPWKVITGGSEDSEGHSMPSLMSKANARLFLFYNGRGELTAKGTVSASQWTFDGTQVLTEPGFLYDILSVRNTVDVTGGTPKKSKKHFHAQVSLNSTDPFSPQKLARNGVDRHMVEFIQSDSLKSDQACRTRGLEVLKEKSAEVLSARFESMPNPLLEERDLVTLDMPDYRIDFTLKTWTLPLVADTAMSIGFTKNTSRKVTN